MELLNSASPMTERAYSQPPFATLLITHDLGRLDQVDEIVVLDHGKVAERGTHQQLTAAGGGYWQMRQSERA
jgi:ABC-type multidrug transport system fused ATPase/permease subunit